MRKLTYEICMKKLVTLVGTSILLASLSSYIVEKKETIYVEPAPVVEEKIEVIHPYHHHHHDRVIIEEHHHPVIEEEIKLK